MTDPNIYKQWQELCREHQEARDAHFKSLTSLNQKFTAIGEGRSEENPTDEELSRFESTWQAWESIKEKMTNFVRGRSQVSPNNG